MLLGALLPISKITCPPWSRLEYVRLQVGGLKEIPAVSVTSLLLVRGSNDLKQMETIKNFNAIYLSTW